MRADTSLLVYAQWTIRVAYEFQQLTKYRARRPSPLFIALEADDSALNAEQNAGNHSTQSIVLKAPRRSRLHCILCFQGSPSSAALSDGFVEEPKSPITLDITKPNLPSLMARDQVLKQIDIRNEDGALSSVPMYSMEQLFRNHPMGLEAIHQSCLEQLQRTSKPGLETLPYKIGVVENKD